MKACLLPVFNCIDNACVFEDFLKILVCSGSTVSVLYFDVFISVKNPPPLCVAVPYLEIAKVCIKFENVTITNSSVSACIYIEAALEGVVVGEKKLGCFTIPLGGKQNLKEMSPKPKNDDHLYFSPVKSLESLIRQSQFGSKGTRFFGP